MSCKIAASSFHLLYLVAHKYECKYSNYKHVSLCTRGSCLGFHQVALAVEGSTMSGSLQRRKKSKRKWKRLWFLLKDKVLYTFTAREVRGHRVSHTSPKTLMIVQRRFLCLCLALFLLHF